MGLMSYVSWRQGEMLVPRLLIRTQESKMITVDSGASTTREDEPHRETCKKCESSTRAAKVTHRDRERNPRSETLREVAGSATSETVEDKKSKRKRAGGMQQRRHLRSTTTTLAASLQGRTTGEWSDDRASGTTNPWHKG